jgi:hypothetical protein
LVYLCWNSRLLPRSARTSLIVSILALIPAIVCSLGLKCVGFDWIDTGVQFGITGAGAIVSIVAFLVFLVCSLSAAWSHSTVVAGVIARAEEATKDLDLITAPETRESSQGAGKHDLPIIAQPARARSAISSAAVWRQSVCLLAIWCSVLSLTGIVRPLLRNNVQTTPPSVAMPQDSMQKSIVYAAAPIEEGEIIPGEVLETRYVSSDKVPSDAFENIEDLVGTQATCELAAGHYVSRHGIKGFGDAGQETRNDQLKQNKK